MTVRRIHAGNRIPVIFSPSQISMCSQYLCFQDPLMCRPADPLTHSLTTQGRAKKARRFLSQTGEYFTGAQDEMIACYVKGVSRSNRLKQNHTARSLSFSQKQQEASRQTVNSYLVNLATHLAQSCPKSTCQKVSWHKLLPHYSSFLYSEHSGLRDYTGNQ